MFPSGDGSLAVGTSRYVLKEAASVVRDAEASRSGDRRLIIVDRNAWYLLIDCKNCGRCSVLGEAPSPQELPELKLAAFSRRCPYCGATGVYQPAEVERVQGIYI